MIYDLLTRRFYLCPRWYIEECILLATSAVGVMGLEDKVTALEAKASYSNSRQQTDMFVDLRALQFSF